MTNHFKLIPLEERIVLDAAIAAVIAHSSNEPIIFVKVSGVGNGTSWQDATNLQHALQLASTSSVPEQIWIAKGTYSPGSTASSTFTIPNDVSIFGGFLGVGNARNPSVFKTILSGVISGGNVDTVVTANNVTAVLDGLTITGGDNTTTNGGSGLGGGLTSVNSSLTLSDLTFSNNMASAQGGAIFANGDSSLNIMNSEFLNNSSVRGGSIRTEFSGAVNISGSDFNGNTASLFGGALYATSDTSDTISFTNFENNSSNANRNGGAIRFLQDQNVNVNNSNFNNNSSGDGGAIISSLDQNITFSDNTFNNNFTVTPNGGGGAIYSVSDQNLLIIGNIFNHNYANGVVNNPDAAGAIQVTGDGTSTSSGTNTAMILSNTFIDNSSQFGGAIGTAANGTLIISKNLFLNNTATVEAGAIGLGNPPGTPPSLASPVDTNVTISQNLFINNKGGQFGGALATGQEVNLTINDNLFIHNNAVNGGAIADAQTVALNITNNVFAANSATQGNSIWLDSNEGTVNGANPLTNSLQVITNLVNDNLALFSNDIYIA